MKRTRRLFYGCFALAFLNPVQLLAGEFSWQLLGPSAPVVSQLASVSQTSAALLANINSTLYRSTDGGATWQVSMAGLESLPTTSGRRFVVSPADPAVLLLFGYSKNDVFRSMDGGKTWVASTIGSTTGSESVSLAFHPTQARRAYAIVLGDGIYRSDDAGVSWQKSASISEAPSAIGGLVALDDSANLYLGYTVPMTPGIALPCIITATEGSTAWSSPECLGLGAFNDLVAGTGGAIYALTTKGLSKKDDRNASWRPLLPDRNVYSLLLPTEVGKPFYLGTGDGVLQSADQGASWASPGTMAAALPVVSALTHAGGALYAGTRLGVYKSADQAASWQSMNTGLPALWVSQLFIAGRSGSTQYALGNAAGIVRSSDDWATFQPVSLGTSAGSVNTLSIDPGNSAELLAGTTTFLHYSANAGTIFRSTDAGKTWTPTLSQGMVNMLVRDPVNPARVYAATGDGVYGSDDNGASWRRLSAPPVGATLTGVDAVAVAPDNPKKLFASQGASLAVSNDGGTSWRVVLTLEHDPIGAIRQIQFDPSRPATVYVADRRGVHKSTDSGEHWQAVYTVANEESSILSLLLDPDMPQQLYLGLNNGMLLSKDDGSSWNTSGLPSIRIESLQFKANTLYAATENGIYRAEREASGGEDGGSGGGCSVGKAAGGSVDPMLWVLVAAALVGLRRRVMT